MSGRKTVIGLCMLCAMAFSAVAAQGASASGTTAFTFGSETAIANGETTELSGSGGLTTLKTVSSGITLIFTAQKVSVSGSMVNSQPGTEGISSGSGVITYEEVAVTAPAGKGCRVAGGTVTTNELTATTAEQGMFLKFTPTAGTVFAAWTIEGCSLKPLNKELKIEGAVKGVPTGTEVVFTHAETTSQGTLTVGGQKSGLDGVLNYTARANSGQSFTALEAKT